MENDLDPEPRGFITGALEKINPEFEIEKRNQYADRSI